MKILRDALKARMANTSNAYRGDFLDQILEDLKNKMFMTEELVLQTLFGLLFATSESTSMTLALAFKFLSENPPVMKELMVSTYVHSFVPFEVHNLRQINGSNKND